MSSVYYAKNDSGKITYLTEGIRSHAIFKVDMKFWETCFLYKIFNRPAENAVKSNRNSLSNVSSPQSPPNIVPEEKKARAAIEKQIVTVGFYMKDMIDNKQQIKDICLKLMKQFSIPEIPNSELSIFINNLTKTK